MQRLIFTLIAAGFASIAIANALERHWFMLVAFGVLAGLFLCVGGKPPPPAP